MRRKDAECQGEAGQQGQDRAGHIVEVKQLETAGIVITTSFQN